MRAELEAAQAAIDLADLEGVRAPLDAVRLVEDFCTDVGATFEDVAARLSDALGMPIYVGFSDACAFDGWVAPVSAYSDDDEDVYALADAVVEGWDTWLLEQLQGQREKDNG